ncbi:alpha/beta hydrolase [Pollutibacter soli]|uniref:alpha/beta fold hydrolase n=1 Tax=Pollutibacter soli TaxID=3034157 RepID=UPI0030140804
MRNRRLFFLACVATIFSCTTSEKKTELHDDVKALPAVVTAGDGTKLSYIISGDKDTTLLFLHGWAINKTYWDSQLAFFSPQYNVVAIDQAGFGNSDTSRTSYSIENYAADVDSVISQLQLKHVVLIGHSMSGDVILEAAIRYPEKIIGLIGIDNFNQPGKEFSAEEKKEIEDFMQKMNADYQNTVIPYAEQSLFHKSTDSSVRKRVKEDILNCNRRASVEAMKAIIDYSPKETEKLGQLKLRLNLLNSDANKTDTASLARATGASFQVFPIHATGHYPMIEKPGDFNRILRQILDSIGAK